MQGGCDDGPSLAILHWAQFIVAEVVAKSNSYYSVPVMRMALDFVVYVYVLLVFGFWILFHNEGTLTPAECILPVYIMVSWGRVEQHLSLFPHSLPSATSE